MTNNASETLASIREYIDAHPDCNNKMTVLLNGLSASERKTQRQAVEELENDGYIQITSNAIGMIGIKLL